jgi:hypothetical protein
VFTESFPGKGSTCHNIYRVTLEMGSETHVHCQLLLYGFNQNWLHPAKFYKNLPTSNFMKICTAVLQLLKSNRRIDKHRETNGSIFSTIRCEFDENSARIMNNIDQRIHFPYTGWCLEFTKTNELAECDWNGRTNDEGSQQFLVW